MTLSSASGTAVTVPFSIGASSTATGGGTDYSYSPANATLSFSSGQTTQNITLTINNDNLDENDETVIINLGSPTNASLGSPSSSTYTIQDDDNPPLVSIAPDSSGLESIASKSVAVTLSSVSGKTISVPFSIDLASTANAPDFGYYPNGPSVLSFTPGQTSQNISLTITGDNAVESDETIIMNLGTPTNAGLGTPTHSTYTILDDDLPVVSIAAGGSAAESVTTRTIAVTLSAAYRSAVIVPFSVNASSTANGGSDYSLSLSPLTFAIGQTTKYITLIVVNDIVDEPDETVVIDLGAPTHATLGAAIHSTSIIQDNDNPLTVFLEASASVNENAGVTPLSVFLSTVSGKTVTVPFSVNVSSTAAGGGTDYWINLGELTFAPGETTQRIGLTVNDDALDEDDEAIVIDLGAPTNAGLGTGASSVRTIVDNDSAPVVTIGANSAGLESVASKVIPVTLSSASGKAVTVPFSVNASSTASGGGVDYAIGNSPLTFAAGEMTHNITINVIADGVNENDESVVIDLGTPTNAGLGLEATSIYTIQDDDKVPTISSIQAVSSSALKLVWSPVLGATGYKIYRSGSMTGSFAQVGGIVGVTTLVDGNLSEATAYWYKLSAVTSTGDSALSPVFGAYTRICEPSGISVAPDKETDPTSRMKVSWMDNSSVENGFILARSPNGTDSWTTVTVGPSAGRGRTVNYNDEGRDEGRRYWYKVRAFK